MGRTQEGIAGLTQEITALAGMGSLIFHPQYLSWLAGGYLIAGQAEDGLKALSEAFAHVKDTGEEYWVAELHRLRGELLLLPGGSEYDAEDCFNQSLDVARKQSAKSLELRSAMSLARLWHKQGKRTEARVLLAGIYGWFSPMEII